MGRTQLTSGLDFTDDDDDDDDDDYDHINEDDIVMKLMKSRHFSILLRI